MVSDIGAVATGRRLFHSSPFADFDISASKPVKWAASIPSFTLSDIYVYAIDVQRRFQSQPATRSTSPVTTICVTSTPTAKCTSYPTALRVSSWVRSTTKRDAISRNGRVDEVCHVFQYLNFGAVGFAQPQLSAVRRRRDRIQTSRRRHVRLARLGLGRTCDGRQLEVHDDLLPELDADDVR